ncbi:MAG: hypothetical protein A4E63_01996 [Syntrophorhabdus sp. PtaU1.Bin050]|nr:MAG: hypothetical protein A4E63_01996 [Syntrophorhabdus sp. PtaU1.Bin050]
MYRGLFLEQALRNDLGTRHGTMSGAGGTRWESRYPRSSELLRAEGEAPTAYAGGGGDASPFDRVRHKRTDSEDLQDDSRLSLRRTVITSEPYSLRTCTNLDSKIERGDKEEATEAYISVRRGDDDEGNKVV